MNPAAKEPLPGRLGYLGKSPGSTLSQPARGNGAASASVISTVPSAATAGVGPPNGWTCETPREAGRRTGRSRAVLCRFAAWKRIRTLEPSIPR